MSAKAAIRKKIGKQEGDWLEIILFADNDPLQIPSGFIECRGAMSLRVINIGHELKNSWGLLMFNKQCSIFNMPWIEN